MISSLDDLCEEGLCYRALTRRPTVEGRGLCQLGLPTRGQACSLTWGVKRALSAMDENGGGGASISNLYRACGDNAEVNGCELDEVCLPD